MDSYLSLSNNWRQHNGYANAGGVVVLYDDEIQGWVNELRDPHHWRPGCIAIDEQGHAWKTAGGDNYNGANRWEAIHV